MTFLGISRGVSDFVSSLNVGMNRANNSVLTRTVVTTHKLDVTGNIVNENKNNNNSSNKNNKGAFVGNKLSNMIDDGMAGGTVGGTGNSGDNKLNNTTFGSSLTGNNKFTGSVVKEVTANGVTSANAVSNSGTTSSLVSCVNCATLNRSTASVPSFSGMRVKNNRVFTARAASRRPRNVTVKVCRASRCVPPRNSCAAIATTSNSS